MSRKHEFQDVILWACIGGCLCAFITIMEILFAFQNIVGGSLFSFGGLACDCIGVVKLGLILGWVVLVVFA